MKINLKKNGEKLEVQKGKEENKIKFRQNI